MFSNKLPMFNISPLNMKQRLHVQFPSTKVVPQQVYTISMHNIGRCDKVAHFFCTLRLHPSMESIRQFMKNAYTMLRLRSARGISKHRTPPQTAKRNSVNATKAASNTPSFPLERVSIHLYQFLCRLLMDRIILALNLRHETGVQAHRINFMLQALKQKHLPLPVHNTLHPLSWTVAKLSRSTACTRRWRTHYQCRCAAT